MTSDPAGINCGMTCSAEISYSTLVTLTATAGSGYLFSGWGGAYSGTHGCIVTMDGTKSISAYFVRYVPHMYLPALHRP